MQPTDRPVARRRLLAACSASVAALAGCSDASDAPAGDDAGGGTASDDADAQDGESADDAASGDADGDDGTDDGASMGTLELTSPAFEDGERIPQEYGYDHENVNPPLRIDGVPDGAASLALIVDDPDAREPAGKVWDHWIVWNVPPETTEIPEDWQPDAAEQGTNDFGEVGWGGPAPPDRPHRYRFTLFALDATLDLSTETDADALRDATEGHVLERTRLHGTYPAE